ncbi:dUTP diphosphatase [Clostridium sp. SM-530-WT-3G]|uniref:dUTP diphosphatase n=1 Tax=Clostridium sp. SM-530-WT-3G TaxID=2725303 RepID=UPI00145F1910|nr:dUTP diphosphatase [Clostridium sp. SM-530-WT-3G]NME84298.1 dUTPase [Clostridium sp. SM-530-WT-3G]
MDIQPMLEMQKRLNETLNINTELDSYKLTARKNLEFEIALGALANETNCFNYLLDNIKDIDIDKIFTKYIKCISQVLTLGIDKKYSDINEISMKPNDYCLSDQFLNLYIDINDLIASPSVDHYQTLFEDLLSLGLTLGFSEEKIQNEFLKVSDTLLLV